MVRPTQEALVARRMGAIELGLHASRSYVARHGTPAGMQAMGSHALIGFDRETAFIRSFTRRLPRLRIIPLDDFHLPRKLARKVRGRAFTVTVDTDFAGVMAACAEPTDHAQRQNTWINAPILAAYTELHRLGFAHSVECWNAEGEMVGGLYGVHLGAAFFGESMFSRATDASKVALVHLVARLIAGGFELLDTQYVTEHLRSFGAVEIPRRRYRTLLDRAIAGEPADFRRLPPATPLSGARALEIVATKS